MALELLKELIPDYAKEQRRNIDALLESPTLGEPQKWGCLLAAAMTLNNEEVLRCVHEEARKILSDNAIEVVRACSTAMTLNNVGFRAKHWLGQDFEDVRFGLRNTVYLKPGVSQSDYELWAVVVSATNGCEHCIQEHAEHAQAEGNTPGQVWEAVRIAAVVAAVGQCIATEQILSQARE